MNINYLKNILSHKFARVIFYILTFIVVLSNGYKSYFSYNSYEVIDYLFLTILLISFVLVNKFSVSLKNSYLNFNDYIIIICYFKFNIFVTVFFLLGCFIIVLLLERKSTKDLNLLTENNYIFNNCLIIISTYLSHIGLNYIKNIYYIEPYMLILVIVFSTLLLISNYLLFCIDASIQKGSLVLITLENGLYFIILNYILCSLAAIFSLYLSVEYFYVPIIILTALLIFLSFTLNNLDTLRKMNANLKSISNCTTYVISKGDFKSKLYVVMQTIEQIIPFVCCSIYFFRDKYSSIFPLCYKSNILIDVSDLKFNATTDNLLYNEILSGQIIIKANKTNALKLFSKYSKEIKYSLIIPVKSSEKVIGFINLYMSSYPELDEEIEHLSILGNQIALVNDNISTLIKNNNVSYKNYDGLRRYIDYNIKNKVFFTLSIIEIENYDDIITKYNIDFYETYKSEISKLIGKFISPNDYVLCFEKENIYILFNLLDTSNTVNKLKEIADLLNHFKFRDVDLCTKIIYSTSEYPVEGVSTDEILSTAYSKLLHFKNNKVNSP